MKKFKSLCLILIVFGINIMNSQDINYKNLVGIEHSSLVGDSIKLEKNTFIAFEKMQKAALNDGFKIKIVSGFRGFERQKQIWNSKFKRFTKDYYLSDKDAIKEIVRFSTIPGTSRHHWGTEIDVIDEEIIMDPLTTVDITSQDSEKVSDLSNKIEELDDVQNVYMNVNLS